MKINNDVTNVLANSRIDGDKLFLPEGQLDRKLYMSVNKVLTSINGKWSRKDKAHVFSAPPAEIIEEILLTGEYVDSKKEYQFFETPTSLAAQLVDMASPSRGDTICEPNAGRARIVNAINAIDMDCDCVELNPDNRKHLERANHRLVGDDFMSFNGEYDIFIANPPFSKQQDIDHISHMMDLARKRVVSVASASVLFRDNKKTVVFRERVFDLGGTIEPLPDNTFLESGTAVKTCVVSVDI